MESGQAKVRALLQQRKAAIRGQATTSPEADRLAVEALFRRPANPAIRQVPTQVGGVPGHWLVPPDVQEGRVVYYLHGGSYLAGGLETHQHLVGRLAVLCRARVLLLEYRLAPEHPFPAAVEDAVAGYTGILDAGWSPGETVVVGDSAGGGLALALFMWGRDRNLPLPAGAVLLSPWTDLACTAPSLRTRAEADPWLVAEAVPREAALYLAGADPKNPLASPLYGDLAGLPPLLIHVGEDEILLDDATRLAAKAKEAGVLVTLKVWANLWHVFHLFWDQVPAADAALHEIGQYVDRLLA